MEVKTTLSEAPSGHITANIIVISIILFCRAQKDITIKVENKNSRIIYERATLCLKNVLAQQTSKGVSVPAENVGKWHGFTWTLYW